MSFSLPDTFTDLAKDKVFIRNVRDIIVNRVFFEDPSEFFTITPAIKGQKQIAGSLPVSNVLFSQKGCSPDVKKLKLPFFSQEWNPRYIGLALSWCYTDFAGSFARWGLANGHDRYNLDEADFFNFLIDRVAEALRTDILKAILYGDKDIADTSLNDAGKAVKETFKIIDKGLIPSLLYFKTGESGADAAFDETEFADRFVKLSMNNAEDDKQFDFAPDYARNLFQSLVTTNDFDGDTLLTSESLYLNYKNYLRTSFELESSKAEIQKGIKTLNIDGQKIVPIRSYDKFNRMYYTTPTNMEIDDPDNPNQKKTVQYGRHLYPHFAIYTTKENLQVAVDSEAALSDLRFERVGGTDDNFYVTYSHH